MVSDTSLLLTSDAYPSIGYIWFGTNLLISFFTFFVVPETNKRTLEEIDECYNQKVPIRKFPEYECQAVLNSRLEAVRDAKLERE